MSAHFIKMTVACLLVLGVALIFVSEGAEADTITVDENGLVYLQKRDQKKSDSFTFGAD